MGGRGRIGKHLHLIMNDLLNPYQLNEAICALLKEASRRVTMLVPQRMLPLLDLNSFADSAEERPDHSCCANNHTSRL